MIYHMQNYAKIYQIHWTAIIKTEKVHQGPKCFVFSRANIHISYSSGKLFMQINAKFAKLQRWPFIMFHDTCITSKVQY